MKRLARPALAAVITLGILLGAMPVQAREAARLDPGLAPFQFMVGFWNCKSWVAAAGPHAPRVDHTTARYSIVGKGSLGQKLSGPAHRSFEIFDYKASSMRIVTAEYGDDGAHLETSSRGWMGNAITLNGRLHGRGPNADLRDILLKFTDRRFTHTTEIRDGSHWKTVANSDCNKT